MKPKRHKIEGRDGPLFWYSIGDNVAVFPFTRSRMNRKTLGCYGKSARTNPLRTCWMWGVCYMNADGKTPSTWDSVMQCFTAPIASRAHDLKADAVKQATELANSMSAFAKAEEEAFNNRSELARRICLRVYGDSTHAADYEPLWKIIDEEVLRKP